MKLLFKLLLFLVTSFSIKAFDVRVLLGQFSIADVKKIEFFVSSQSGVFISGIENQIDGPLSIVCTDKEIKINGILLDNEWIQISPALSMHHKKKIDNFIAHWLKTEHGFRKEQFLKLSHFYEKFVLDRNFRDYEQLYVALQACINSSIASFIEPIEHPVMSYESLVELAQTQLTDQLKTLLTKIVAGKNVSSSMLKQLQTSEKSRIDFFDKVLDQVLLQFLTKFFLELPHKIIYQGLQEDPCCLQFDKNKYVGNFYIVRQGNDVLLINSLDIDDYLLSVVFSEGWPGWPMEVNKALVVANRTYLVEKILQTNKTKRPYHIVNTIKHQTYKGHHKFTALKQAVDETRNILVAYKGKPIVAMFDSCCGGVIPAKIEGLDCKKHPYLARVKPCTYCKKTWIYSWSSECSKLEITEALRKDHPNLHEIKDIRVAEYDAAGLVKKVIVTTLHEKIYVSGKRMYSLFPSIKSFCYSIKKKGKGYLFQGRGFGHHKGLCQWGSLGMVEDNWNYKKILQFYYPGTEFMQLSLAR